MRLRSFFALGTAALLLISGCTAEPTPTPKPTVSPSASETPTPTPEPIVEPEAAFDVTCDVVAAEMRALVGEPSSPVEPALSVVSTMSWIPGPAQYMFQRAGGIACSAGATGEQRWEVALVPGAESVIAGATERSGYFGEQARCEAGMCFFTFPEGEVLLTASVHAPGLGSADIERVEQAMRRLAASASASIREVEYIPSEIVGLPCERFITEQEVAGIVGEDVGLFTDFGGWGIPAEVYEYVNGSRICYFRTSTSEYEGAAYLMLTTLPAGAWAFEKLDGAGVDVEGADAAKASVGENGENILDVRVGADWLRFMTYDNGAGAADPSPLATTAVRNLTVGPTAPQ
ncbi:hypothetical protein [Microbacterium foliorum]|uniref:hypothetical protein n=1 Tax=Microbacterium foliorum TaxID=104336 RepID=UPI001DDF551A|nr:hypothetical protein [Microbacterium foliorum]CAH0145622.1 hypothetical protein SRABI44_00582 [Microbacterium foliorum]CAH0147083.1 hypothetical protein SRABI03_00665 [Microbacterium foliorum]